MTRPNRDLDQAGHTLQNILAVNMTQALEHLQREMSVLDGFPERGDSVQVSASAELTSVERAANGRYEIRLMVEDLRDAKQQVLSSIRILNELCNTAMRMRQPKQVTKPPTTDGLCCSSQGGKHAVDVWGDALCFDRGLSNRGGLCERHWKAWYRARKKDGISTAADFTPTTDDHGNEVAAWA